MYRLLRNTHLLIGLLLAATVLIYGLSTVLMVHRAWFPWTNQTSERTVALEPGQVDGRAVARSLMEKHQVWGDLAQVSPADGGLRVRIVRPGEVNEATYVTGTGHVTVRTQRADFGGMLVALHHARGLDHESISATAWGVLVGLTSLGLMILGGTGVYLWFHIHRERVIGGVILAISVGASLALILTIRAAQ